MAVMRQDMFGDGTVSMEYYPHKRIELRVAGFKVVVSKPYGSQFYTGNHTVPTPCIQMSANSTVALSLKQLNLINKSVLKAIEMLNNENDGLIINPDFDLAANTIQIKNTPPEIIAIQQSKNAGQAVSVKSIPYKEITANKVYADVKGKRWIYLGEGWLYNNGSRDNRTNDGYSFSKYIYINYDELCRWKWQLQGNTIIVEGRPMCLIDSYASKKRFVKVADILDNSVKALVSEFETYRFEEHKSKIR